MDENLESRLTSLIGRASLEAFRSLQQLRDHPKLDDLVTALEAIEGTLHQSHIAEVLRRVRPER